MARVFLSYSSKDQELAERIANDLNREGVGVWIDIRQVDIGDSIVESISTALQEHDYFAILLTKNSVMSPWVKKELNIALMKSLDSKSITILPVLCEDCEIPEFLLDLKYADFRHSYGSGIQDLMRLLKHNNRRLTKDGSRILVNTREMRSSVELIDVRMIQKREDKECLFPIFDFNLINRGHKLALLNRLEVEILECLPIYRPLSECCSVFVSEQYNLMLSPLEEPSIKSIDISHSISFNEASRFQVKIGSDQHMYYRKEKKHYRDKHPFERSMDVLDAVLYRVKFLIYFNSKNVLETLPFTFKIDFPGSFMYFAPPELIGPNFEDKIKALKHKNPNIRLQAVQYIGLIGDTKAIPKLRKVLSDKQPEIVYEAIIALARLGEVGILEQLEQRLSDAVNAGDGHKIRRIASSIINIKSKRVAAILCDTLNQMLAIQQEKRGDTEFDYYWWPMDSLIEGMSFFERLDLLEQFLSSNSSGIRARIADQIGKIGGNIAQDMLVHRLQNENDYYVCYRIVASLKECGSQIAIPYLTDLMKRVNIGNIEDKLWFEPSLKQSISDCIERIRLRKR